MALIPTNTRETAATVKAEPATVPPAEWSRTLMNQIGTTYGGLTGKTKADFGRGTAQYVTFLNVIENIRIDPSRLEPVDVGTSESQNLVLHGDLLFNGTSETPEDVALAGVVMHDIPRLYLNSFCFGFRITSPHLCDGEFIAYFFRSPQGRQLVSALAQGATRYNVSKRQFLALSLPLPPPPEQQAIAEALSDIDGLLGAVDALIAKKQSSKQAVMQLLLTGRMRLPGFSKKWNSAKLGDISEITGGATPSTQVAGFWNGPIPWCTPTDITREPGKYLRTTARTITSEGLDSCRATLLPPGALLFCSRATIGDVKIAAVPVCTNQGFQSLVCRDSVDNEFLYYMILTHKDSFIERAAGSTFLEIGRRDIASVEFILPELDEQRSIAGALSDMDAEIRALEARLDKTRAIKLGMMQQLLTGRIRLAKPTPTKEATA